MFIDASALVACYLRRDQYHARAIAAWADLVGDARTLRTTTLVVAEALNFIGKNASAEATATAGLEIYRSLRVEEVHQADAIAGLAWLRRYADQQFSYVDCTSFVVMRRLKLKRAFTFDHHFAIVGFEVWPV